MAGKYVEGTLVVDLPLYRKEAPAEYEHKKDVGGNDLPDYREAPVSMGDKFELEIPEYDDKARDKRPTNVGAELTDIMIASAEAHAIPAVVPVGRHCGECGMCCKLLGVPSIEKPRGVMCKNYGGASVGCKVHSGGRLPSECGTFACMWLQDATGMFGEDWRPDNLRLVWTTTSKQGVLAVWLAKEDQDALRREDVITTLHNLASSGYTVMGMIGGEVIPLAVPKDKVVAVKDGVADITGRK